MDKLKKIISNNHKLLGFLIGVYAHPAVQGIISFIRP